jgi:hypothetical protein
MPSVFKYHSEVNHSDINKCKIKNWRGKKTELSGKNLLKRQRSALLCSAAI